MLGTDCPFSNKECNLACALYNQNYRGCNINSIAEKLQELDSTVYNLSEAYTLKDICESLSNIDANTTN